MKNIFLQLLLLSTLFLTGCVNLSKKVSFFVLSDEKYSYVNVYVTKPGLYTNIHGGNSDSFEFVVPRRMDNVNASQFVRVLINHKEAPLVLSSKSEIIINSAAGLCSVTLMLFDAEGKALDFNGTYKAKYDGSEYENPYCRR